MSIRLQIFLFLFCGVIFTACSDYDYASPSPGRRVKVEALTPPVGPPIYVTREVNEPGQ